jgi:hypothetical protein
MLGQHIRDVRLTSVDFFDPLWIQVKAGNGKAGLGEHHGLGQADVAQADDADAGGAVKDLAF